MIDDHKQYLETVVKEAEEKGSKGIVSESYKDEIFRSLRGNDSDNLVCYDCLNSNASWCSITYAIFLCLVCSGNHRQKGTHLSFVRSTNLDNFNYEQLTRFLIGGNKRCRTYMRTHSSNRDGKLDVKMNCAKDYRHLLDAEVAKILSLSTFNPPAVGVSSSPTTSEQKISGLKNEMHSLKDGGDELVESTTKEPSPLYNNSNSNNKVTPQIPQVSRNTTTSSRPLIVAKPAGSRKPVNNNLFLGSRISPSATPKLSPRVPEIPQLSPILSEGDGIEPVELPTRTKMPGLSSADYFSSSIAKDDGDTTGPQTGAPIPPRNKMPALSSADYFGYSEDSYTQTRLGNERLDAVGGNGGGGGKVNIDDIYMKSQIMADQAKDTASRLAEEGSELMNRGLEWFRTYYG